MPRKRPEWIGKTPDTPVPPRVIQRVFDRWGGICHISGRKIEPGDAWDMDHVVALVNGGENRESNLAPALREKHREKTAEDVAMKSRDKRKRKKFLGIKSIPSRPINGSKSSGFKVKVDGTVLRRGK